MNAGGAHSDDVQNTQQAVDTVPRHHVLHHRLCPILEKTGQDRTSAGRNGLRSPVGPEHPELDPSSDKNPSVLKRLT